MKAKTKETLLVFGMIVLAAVVLAVIVSVA